jgi:hypothetical protein
VLTSDRPWPMIFSEARPSLTSLRITRYRGLASVSFDGLARLNLLVGANDAGKTRLLETVYLLFRRADPRGLLDTIRARIHGDPETLAPRKLLRLLPRDVVISGSLSDSTETEVEHVVTDEPPTRSTDLATFVASLRIATRGPVETQVSFTELHSNRPRHSQMLEGSRAWLAPVVFDSSFSLVDRPMVADYEPTVARRAKPAILEHIRRAVDHDVIDISLADTDGRFLVQHRTKGILELSSFGEGLQRIFQLGLLFAAHAHGVVLVDGFEHALHPWALAGVSRMIHELAVRFDVQVFLTTQSNEVIEAFLLDEQRAKDVVTFLLKKDGTGTSVRRFAGNSHRRVLDAAGVDVRRL